MTDFNQLRRETEIIKLRESAMYSWREDLSEAKKEEKDDHPYVEVMPEEQDENAVEEKPKKKKKEEEKEEVKEETRVLKQDKEKKKHSNWNSAGIYVGPERKAIKLSPDKKLRKEETEQDGPAPTSKQRKGAMDNIKQNLNSLQNTEDERKLSRKERDKLALQKARAKAWGVKEELSVEDQLKVSQESWKKKAEAKQKKAAAPKEKKQTPGVNKSAAARMADAYASPRRGALGGTRAD